LSLHHGISGFLRCSAGRADFATSSFYPTIRLLGKFEKGDISNEAWGGA
jgi:hypothetical protein